MATCARTGDEPAVYLHSTEIPLQTICRRGYGSLDSSLPEKPNGSLRDLWPKLLLRDVLIDWEAILGLISQAVANKLQIERRQDKGLGMRLADDILVCTYKVPALHEHDRVIPCEISRNPGFINRTVSGIHRVLLVPTFFKPFSLESVL